MKEKDFMRALGSLPQDMLDEFAEWQENGTPISGDGQARGGSVIRVHDTKSAKKHTQSGTRTRPWTIGICAAMAACLVMAVSVGKEAIGRSSNSMSAGYSAGKADAVRETAEHPHDHFDEIEMGVMETAIIPEKRATWAKLIREPEDAELIVPLITPEDPEDQTGENIRGMLTEDFLAEHDVVIMSVDERDLADDTNGVFTVYRCIEVTRDGKLTLDVLCMQHLNPDFVPEHQTDHTHYHAFAVEKGVLPEITQFDLRAQKFHSVQPEYDETDTEWQKFRQLEANADSFRLWLEKEPEVIEVPEDAELIEAVQNDDAPFYAWYWEHYSGNDIAVPADGRLAVLHNADEAAEYLTGSGQQPENLADYLNADWFAGNAAPATEEDAACEPHDVIFVGIPRSKMPENVISWSFRDGTVTPSGKLHLVCNVLTGENTDEPQGENFYFFMSVPKDNLPEITDWSVSFDEFRCDSDADAITSENAADFTEWVMNQAVHGSYWSASLCERYIRPVPEEQPGVVTVQGSRMTHVTDTQAAASACLITGGAQNEPAFAGLKADPEQYDLILITLPADDARAAAGLTGLKVGADGILSLTERIGKDTQEYAEEGTLLYQLLVPKGSVPEIKGIDVTAEVAEHALNAETDDEVGFIRSIRNMMTISVEAGSARLH